MKSRTIAFLLSLIASSAFAFAEPMAYQLPAETAELKPGPGVETAIVCTTCHSADYISTQPSGKGTAFWQAEAQKMIKVYKAPIAEDDVSVIVKYLAATY
ncbi:MAG TPA: cytochrome c [Roseiarcus sp.]|jgi:cytochrome c553